MKKILVLLAVVLFGCSKPDCDEQIDSLNKEYEKAMQYAGGSWSAGFEITKQYKEKLNRINNNCN